jgi:hypothetical protein
MPVVALEYRNVLRLASSPGNKFDCLQCLYDLRAIPSLSFPSFAQNERQKFDVKFFVRNLYFRSQQRVGHYEPRIPVRQRPAFIV